MATIVPNNPVDTQPRSTPNPGIAGGAIQTASTTAETPARTTSPANFSQYNPLSDLSIQTYTPQTSNVDQATETAAGQVASLLSKDSPLLQRARTLAMQNMNQRGLVNSSMSQGAGVAAMIDRITPIAQQDAQTYSNRALSNMDAANTAGQFNAGQNNQLVSQGLDIASRFGMQKDQQVFTTSEREGSQQFQMNLQTAQQNFTSAQNELQRAQEVALADKSITAQQALQAAQQNFQSAQAQLDRAQQITIADKSITANKDLQIGQQTFASAQADLDRTQQSALAQSQIDASKSLETARQQFQSTQNNLDRAQQESMTRLSNDLNKANVSTTFASNLTLQTSAAINAIAADPNLTPEAKKGSIQNIIDGANNTLQWGSTFYGTPLPTISAPGGGAGTLNPGGSYAAPKTTYAPEAMPTNFWGMWNTAHDATGDFSKLKPYVAGKTIEQIMQDTGANRKDAIYILQKAGG